MIMLDYKAIRSVQRMIRPMFLCLYIIVVFGNVVKGENVTLGITVPFFSPGQISAIPSGEYYTAAAFLAQTKVNDEHPLFSGKKLQIDLVETPNCAVTRTLEGFTSQWKSGVDGFVGTGCSCETSAELSGVFNLPLVSQICKDATLSDKSKYPTFVRTIPANNKLTGPVLKLLQHYNWTRTGLVMEDSKEWTERGEEIKKVLNASGVTVKITRNIPSAEEYQTNSSGEYFEKLIRDVQEISRVIILAMDYRLAREALFYAGQLDINKASEYSFIIFALDAKTVWENTASPSKWLESKYSGRTENITDTMKYAFESSLLVAMNPARTPTYQAFVNNLKKMTNDAPVSSNVYEGAGSSNEPPILGAYLYDAVFQLAVALNKTISSSGHQKNGTFVTSLMRGRRYQSILGYERYIDQKGDANFDLILMEFDFHNGNFTDVGKFENDNAGNDVLKMTGSPRWPGNKGPPEDIPKCGFYGEMCRKSKNITIGLLLPYLSAYGYGDSYSAGKYSAPAITVALDRINKDPDLLPNHHINFVWQDTKCNEEMSISQMTEFVEQRVDAFIGFACTCNTQARIAASLNKMLISPYCTSSDVSDKQLYPTFVRTIPDDGSLGPSVVAILDYFNWNEVGLMSEEKQTWNTRAQFIENYLKQSGKKVNIHELTPTELSYDPVKDESTIKNLLEKMKTRSRIIILAMKYSLAREVLYFAAQTGMVSGDYVFIAFELSMDELRNKIKDQTKWFNSLHVETQINFTVNFKDMFKSVLVLSVNFPGSKEYEEFDKQVKIKAPEAPFYSNMYKGFTCIPNLGLVDRSKTPVPIFSSYIYDATRIYALGVNRTINNGSDYGNGREVAEKLLNRKYRSVIGTDIKMTKHGNVEYNLTLLDYRENGTEMMMERVGIFHITEYGNATQLFVLDPNKTIKWLGGRTVPLDVPVCGFDGEFCIDDRFKFSIIEIVCIVLASLVILLLIIGFIIYRKQKIERELASELWRVDYNDVIIRSKRHAGSLRSQVSLLSTDSFDNINQKQLFTMVGTHKAHTVAIKRINKSNIDLTREIRMELNLMRNTRHENLTPFLGACVDPPNICILELYCPKGSLQDILENEDVKLDSMFISSLLNDIVKGMIFLHSSEIRSHGRLKSSNCVVDGRWVLKICDYGLVKFKSNKEDREDLGEYAQYYRKLWTAPELLRMKNPPPQGTQKGDVYSFGIILQELLTRSGPFDLSYYHIEPKEIIEEVTKGQVPYYRPKLSNVLDGVDLPGVREMAEKCWNENPDARPEFEEIRKHVRKHSTGKTTNIMDNMVNMLEKYANNLESLVEERTAQLAEEKRKTDNLLHRMLPP
ncbi:speract receptor-like isoform X2 [Actinia tenebrosa]|nr:speract receptor-like isoform X2 [Actinia tenebrosa]